MKPRVVQLAEIMKIDRAAASEAECRTLPYVGLEHIERDAGHFYIDFRRKPETLLATKYLFTPRHVLYGKLRPNLNKVALPDFDGVCTTEIFPLLPDPKALDRGYLYAVLLSQQFVKWASNSVSGANLPRLDPERLREYELDLPDLSVQRRIAGQLEQADRLRRTRRYAFELTDTFLPAAFLRLFGDPVRNSNHWPVEIFGEFVENLDSRRKPVKEADRARRQGDYPYYGASGIIDYIDEFLFDGTYLLVAEDGMNLVTRSKPVAIVATGQFWVNNHTHVVAPKEFVDIAYLRQFINSRDLKDFVTGIDQMKLTRDNMDRIPVPLPPLPLQKKFAALAERLERLRAVQREALGQAEHLFASLLHRAFSG